MTTTTLILQSGGSVQLQNAFIMGNGVAGDIAGECRRFADEDIAQVIEFGGMTYDPDQHTN